MNSVFKEKPSLLQGPLQELEQPAHEHLQTTKQT